MTAPAPTTAVCDIQCPHLHTPEEASALLGGRPSARTLRDKASRRAIPHTRAAGTNVIAFSHDDIAQLIRDGASGRPTRVRRDSRRHS
ncbi:hypothetical protein [Actinomadura madurae]|uniref:hypothetical protein n=1 Tax=Actinomadura madurae TaxID=1993 RepID=UPI0020D2537D|nr:hypothetical protein [Actinomadura madurae]MCP9947175.1 hypothetical protein [Actinomadura madurae]MCP9963941.1 hypothetical protein [Actinomadura madurae]MCP9976416.1 hypothetical protein [Actinomadura madurae]MCQ0012092.1 hypothetical protein [Actinomadura madurae]MCQ0012608.1 hypothetical protein [Actinomadura madurae]